MLKDDDTKSETVMLSDASDATSLAVRSISKENKPSDMHYVLIPKKKKHKKAFGKFISFKCSSFLFSY